MILFTCPVWVFKSSGTQDGSEDLLLTVPKDRNELQLSFKDLFKIFKAIFDGSTSQNSTLLHNNHMVKARNEDLF